MKLRKTRGVPGSAPGGYEWPTVDTVVVVPDAFALELLAIPDAGFEEVLPEPDPATEVAPVDEDAEVVEAPKRRGRPPKNVVTE